jgi:cysteine desulfurase
VGILYVKDGVNITPLIHGGGQENGKRAGTENVPGIAGTAKALEIALEDLSSETQRIKMLRDQLWNQLSEAIEGIRLNGHPIERLPNNLNVSFKNLEAEGLLLLLNARGVEASMGSACTSEAVEPSHVIRALNVPAEYERGTLRLSLGKYTTKEDISTAAEILISIVKES